MHQTIERGVVVGDQRWDWGWELALRWEVGLGLGLDSGPVDDM